MDSLLVNLIILASALLVFASGWAVLSPSVRDGVVIKLGLILIAAGSAGLALNLSSGDQGIVILRAVGLVLFGLVAIALGAILRIRKRPTRSRRASDWMDLSESKAAGG